CAPAGRSLRGRREPRGQPVRRGRPVAARSVRGAVPAAPRAAPTPPLARARDLRAVLPRRADRGVPPADARAPGHRLAGGRAGRTRRRDGMARALRGAPPDRPAAARPARHARGGVDAGGVRLALTGVAPDQRAIVTCRVALTAPCLSC